MEIRDANARDIGGIRKVARIAWADAYRGMIPEDEQAAFLDRAYSDEVLTGRMASGAFLVAAREDDEVVGFADFFADGGDEAELAAIYVLPALQGRGLGGRLLEAGLSKMPSARKIRVGVKLENAAARGFYESRGFMETEEPVAQISENDPDMLWMILKIDGQGDRRGG